MAVFTALGTALATLGTAAGVTSASAGTAAAAGAGAAAGGGISAAGALSALGTVGGLVGQGVSYVGAQKAEKLRQQQMNLEASRQRRQTIREAVSARASALVQGQAQGAGNSSGLAGGMGQITAQGASNIQGINQGQEIGNAMFRANSMQTIGSTMASIGGSFQDIASSWAKNRERDQRVWG
jgi:hypothetical protein